jgi:hypothetical protein
MKKSVLLGIIGLAAGAATSFGQGFIALDNYDSSAHPLITYGAGGGGTVGSGVTGAGWTVGLYFASSAVTGDATSGNGLVSGNLALGSGAGSTTGFLPGSLAGQFAATAYFQAVPAANGGTATLEIIAYNGADYADSAIRGHSAAFTMPAVMPAVIGTVFPGNVGDSMGSFSVSPVPEPTTLALAGLGGLASLMAFRRKQS